MQSIDWQQVLALDVSCTVDGVHGGKFVDWMAIEMAKQGKCRAYDADKKIIADFRKEKN